MPNQDTNANEGADPTDDVIEQSEKQANTADIAADDEPHKIEKMVEASLPSDTEPASE